MSWIAETWQAGYIPLQHPTFDREGLEIRERHVRHAVRIVGRLDGDDQLGHYVIGQGSIGDILGGLLWPDTKTQLTGAGFEGFRRRGIPAWAFAWPARMLGKTPDVDLTGGAVPVLNKKWAPDNRFDVLRPALPPGIEAVPAGTVGVVLDSSDEKTQEELFFPAGIGPLIAVNKAGDPRMASIVYDLNDKDEIDLDRGARLHSAWRVVRPIKGCVKWDPKLHSLAWQLGRAGRDDLEGLGLVCDAPSAQSPQPVFTQDARERPEPGLNVKVFGAGPFGAIGETWMDARTAIRRGITFVSPATTKLSDSSGRVFQIVRDANGFPIDVVPIAPPPGETSAAEEHKTAPPAPAGLVIAAMGRQAGGPIDCGGPGCPHEIGVTKDSEKVFAAHIRTEALYRGLGGDGPLDFEATPYSDPQPGPYKVPGHLRWHSADSHTFPCGQRPGRWRIEVESYWSGPITRRPPTRRFWGGFAEDGPEGAGCEGEYVPIQPGITFRAPKPTSQDKPDLRRVISPDPAETRQHRLEAPCVLRVEAFRQEASEGGPIYTQAPGRARYSGGTAAGGVVVMPPELDVADADVDMVREDVVASSSTWVFAPGVTTGWGVPDLATGGVKNGHRMGTQPGGILALDQLSTAGVATGVLTVDTNGVMEWQRATEHPIRTVAGNTTLTDADHTLLVDTTGGAVTVTLPASANTQGRIYEVKKIAGANPLTLAASGADQVESNPTFIVTGAGQVKSDGSGNWWIW